MVKHAVAAAALILACALTSCGGDSEERVIAAGSTSVQPYAEILAEAFMEQHPGSEIDVQGGGSAAGITAAESGAAEIGMSSRDLEADEQDLTTYEIARDGLAIVVNPANPVSSLASEQVRDIYTMRISNWSEVGGADAKIHVIAREDGSGTRSAFESLIMGDERINPKSIIQNSNGSIRQLVSSDPDSIGFISSGLVDESVKYLKLDGFAPTRENLINGSYRLYRPFLFVTKGQPTDLALQFIDFTLSPAGQQMLTNEGLVSLKDEQ